MVCNNGIPLCWPLTLGADQVASRDSKTMWRALANHLARYNPPRRAHGNSVEVSDKRLRRLEARAGIEPACTDLQSVGYYSVGVCAGLP